MRPDISVKGGQVARAIVRFSIQAGQIKLRNKLRNQLEAAGFTRIGTSSFEAPDMALGEAMPAVIAMLASLETARLDHVWVYIDESEPA